MQRSRLLYTAVVHPAIMYGSQIWSRQQNGAPTATNTMKPLIDTQKACLRRVTGAYRGTPRAAIEKEAGVPPLNTWAEAQAMKSAIKTANTPVEQDIQRTVQAIWDSLATRSIRRNRPPTQSETLRMKAEEQQAEIRAWRAHQTERRRRRSDDAPRRHRSRREHQYQRQQQQRQPTTRSPWRDWLNLAWAQQWNCKRARRRETTWVEPWMKRPKQLYDGLTKAQATALFLMRTEAIGLNRWLTTRFVPGVSRECPCGWHEQTVEHILFHCPRYNRTALSQQLQSERLAKVLGEPQQAAAAAKWLINQGVLQQFAVAKAIQEEDISGYQYVEDLSQWRDDT